MKRFLFILFVLANLQVLSQNLKNRPFFWYLPSSNTRIDGIASGLWINDFKNSSPVSKTIVNGVCAEIIGMGTVLPLTPSHPLHKYDDSIYQNSKNIDSLVNFYMPTKYFINGISLSIGGIVGPDIKINGLNLSGISTLTAKTNGLSVSTLINISGIVNGVSIGGIINNTIQTKGLQIGIFNKTKILRGIQIGLWNVNEKRKLPIINWNFKK